MRKPLFRNKIYGTNNKKDSVIVVRIVFQIVGITFLGKYILKNSQGNVLSSEV